MGFASNALRDDTNLPLAAVRAWIVPSEQVLGLVAQTLFSAPAILGTLGIRTVWNAWHAHQIITRGRVGPGNVLRVLPTLVPTQEVHIAAVRKDLHMRPITAHAFPVRKQLTKIGLETEYVDHATSPETHLLEVLPQVLVNADTFTRIATIKQIVTAIQDAASKLTASVFNVNLGSSSQMIRNVAGALTAGVLLRLLQGTDRAPVFVCPERREIRMMNV